MTQRVTAGNPYDAPKSKDRPVILKWVSGVSRKRSSSLKSRSLGKQDAKKVQVGRTGTASTGGGNNSVSTLSFLSWRHFLGAAAIALVGVLLVLGLVRANHQSVAYSYEISQLTNEKQDLLEVNRQLKMELAKMTSLDQLELVAKNSLGLVVPQKGQIVVID